MEREEWLELEMIKQIMMDTVKGEISAFPQHAVNSVILKQ